MAEKKYIRLFGLVVVSAGINIAAFSPALIGLEIGGSALETAAGVTLLVATVMGLLYGSNALLFRQQAVVPVKEIKTHEDYAEALSFYKPIKALEEDIRLALTQLVRMKKKKQTLLGVLAQRFDPNELSYKKFASVTQEVEKLFYLNMRSVLNRLHVFDESEYESVMRQKAKAVSRELLEEKAKLYNEYLSFVKSSLGTNEEILLKLDKLLLEISRLDSFEIGDIERMPCMQEIDALIKQTKYYKQ